MSQTFYAISTFTSLIPVAAGSLLKRLGTRRILLMNCLSLLLLGAMLATLSTLNYSLGFFTGLAASPLSFTHLLLSKNSSPPPSPTNDEKKSKAQASIKQSKTPAILSASCYVLLLAISPPAIIQLFSAFYRTPVRDMLLEASAAWTIHGTYTALVVWVVWWPAWFVGAATVGVALAGG